MTRVTAAVDAHVHLHDCYDVDRFFDHAWDNLNAALPPATSAGARACCLLFTECAGDDYFGALRRSADGYPARPDGHAGRRWRAAPTGEPESLVVDGGERRLYLIAGRHIACREGLEILRLGTLGRFEDRRPIDAVLAEGAALGLPQVIPWGAGKWFFRRARLLSRLIRDWRGPLFFLGDEGGRPAFWPYPGHFREAAALGVRDLPGTDPLPFAHDIGKVGRVGFRIELEFDASRPAASLIGALRSNVAYERFARLEPPGRFVRNQIAMQLRKRRAA